MDSTFDFFANLALLVVMAFSFVIILFELFSKGD